ncbi:MAG TPA: hypothetical protein PLB52_03585 [Candidatus Moranbacteria bacterium]|nr:hypothetical protein [Candidatus Moranbacteria bacterium]
MKKTKLLLVLVLALALGLGTSIAFAKSDNANKSNKTEKSAKSQEKSKTVNLKNFEKPDTSKGQTNAQVHKVKTQAVVENLEQVAVQEESAGNTQVSNQIETVAAVQEQIQPETVAAIEEIESRGKIKTFLVGNDYKNLGQLRSDLVHNRNQIRQLTQTMAQVQNGGDTTLIQEQLATLMQERERIKGIITTNESSFSLFGWVSRFLFNYEQTPINEEEETQLTEEVKDAIDEAATVEEVAPTTETPATTETPVTTTPTTETTTPTTTTPGVTESTTPAAEGAGTEL